MGGLMGDPSTDLTSVGSPALLALARMFVDLTIREADIAKNINSGDPNAMVTFYTVGLGLPPNDAGTTDPYEFEMQDSYVHGILLRKLANDPASAADPVFIPGTSNFNPNQNTGQFFETNDTTQIAPVLQTIINKGLQTIKVTEYDDS